jgi:hypothetical protein
MKTKARVHFVPEPNYFNLNSACKVVQDAFRDEGFGCYLVGSSLVRRDYRDVDVRYIMADAEFDLMFPGAVGQPHLNAKWTLLCTSIALFLQLQSNLPIDFQIQRMTEANKEFPDSARHPLGCFLLPNPSDYTFRKDGPPLNLGTSGLSSSSESAPDVQTPCSEQ